MKEIKELIDVNGNITYPITSSDAVFMDDGSTINEKLNEFATKSDLTTDVDAIDTRLTTAETKLGSIADGAEVNVNADWNATEGDAHILNKPTIPSIDGLATETYVDTEVATKQDTLVSGTTIKTVNGESLLGSGNIVLSSGGGDVNSVNGKTGTVVLVAEDIADVYSKTETDTALSAKADTTDVDAIDTRLATAEGEIDALGGLLNLNIIEDKIYTFETASQLAYETVGINRGQIIRYRIADGSTSDIWEMLQYNYGGSKVTSQYYNRNNWSNFIGDGGLVIPNNGYINVSKANEVHTLESAIDAAWIEVGYIRGLVVQFRNASNILEVYQFNYNGSQVSEGWFKNLTYWIKYADILENQNTHNYLIEQTVFDINYLVENIIYETFDAASRAVLGYYNALKQEDLLLSKYGFIMTYKDANNHYVTKQRVTGSATAAAFVNESNWRTLSYDGEAEVVYQKQLDEVSSIVLSIYDEDKSKTYTLTEAIERLLEIKPNVNDIVPINAGFRLIFKNTDDNGNINTYEYLRNGNSQVVNVRYLEYWRKIYYAPEPAPSDGQGYIMYNGNYIPGGISSKSLIDWGELPKGKEDLKIVSMGNSFMAQIYTHTSEMLAYFGHTQVVHRGHVIGGSTLENWYEVLEAKSNTELMTDLVGADVVTIQQLSAKNVDYFSMNDYILKIYKLLRRYSGNPKLAMFIYLPPGYPAISTGNLFGDTDLWFDSIVSTFEKLQLYCNIPRERIIFGGTVLTNLRKLIVQTSGYELTYDLLHPLYGLPYVATSVFSTYHIFSQIFDNIDWEEYLNQLTVIVEPTTGDGVDYSKALSMTDANRPYVKQAITDALFDNFSPYNSSNLEPIIIDSLKTYNENLV